MKKLIYTSVLLLFISTACKKSSSSSSAPVSANLGGKTFTTAQSQGLYYSATNQLTIVGYTIAAGDTSLIELDLDGTATIGTPVSFANGQTVSYTDTKNSFGFTGDQYNGHGSVTITSWDKTNNKISGTFNGVLQDDFNQNDSLVVTNGQFSVGYVPF
jgi:hypothetical protein